MGKHCFRVPCAINFIKYDEYVGATAWVPRFYFFSCFSLG